MILISYDNATAQRCGYGASEIIYMEIGEKLIVGQWDWAQNNAYPYWSIINVWKTYS